MRVLHVVESLDRGGLERVVVDLATAQKAAGHDVSVCCLFKKGLLAEELAKGNVPVTCAGKRDGFDYGVVRHIRQQIRLLRTEVLHSHNAVANYYSALASLFNADVRLVNTRHGMGTVRAASVKERLYRISLLRTFAVAAVCTAAARHFAYHGIVPRKMLGVVHNGIPLDRFPVRDTHTAAAARSTLGIDSEAIVIGTVGRLNWAKDQAMLIEAFSKMHARTPHARLVIVGDGELRDSLTQQIDDAGLNGAVLLLGDRNDVSRILPAFDIFTVTSVTEGYSIALLEAAAVGVPIVASDVGGNREIVRDGGTGLLVRERTADGFAVALDRLARDPDLRLSLASGAYAWAKSEAGLHAMVENYDRFYRSQIGGSLAANDEAAT